MSTQQMSRLSASGLLGIGTSDLHGRVIEANDEFLRILGRSADDLAHERFRWDECTAPEHLPRDHRAMREVLETGRCAPFEKDYLRPDGTRVRVLIGLARSETGSDEFVFYVVDLSRRARSDTDFIEAVDAANTGTWDWNIATGHWSWSAKTTSLLGYAPTTEPSFDNLVRRVHPADHHAIRTQLEKTVKNPRGGRLEFRVCPPDGPERWLLSKGSVFFNEAGQPVRAAGTLVDISDWKRNQQAYEHAIGARNEFLSVASHELRTPLTSLRLRAEMLVRKSLAAADGLVPFSMLSESVQVILRLVTRMDALVKDMTDASRLLHGKVRLDRKTVNIVELLETFVRNARQEHPGSAELVWEPPEDDALLKLQAAWSARQVEQVLDNFVSNAMKYGGGRPVVVRLAGATNDTATIEVVDRGIGIEPETLSRIFLPFERAAKNEGHPGFGLGLFVVGEIVKAQGGHLSVDSVPGEGSTFRVHLPLKERSD